MSSRWPAGRVQRLILWQFSLDPSFFLISLLKETFLMARIVNLTAQPRPHLQRVPAKDEVHRGASRPFLWSFQHMMQHKCNGLEHETRGTGSVISVIAALACLVTLEGYCGARQGWWPRRSLVVYDGKGLWFQKHVSSVFIEQRQSTTTEKSRLESMNFDLLSPPKV